MNMLNYQKGIQTMVLAIAFLLLPFACTVTYSNQLTGNEIAIKVQNGIEKEVFRNNLQIKEDEKKEIDNNIKIIVDAIRDDSRNVKFSTDTANWIVKGIVEYCSDPGVINSRSYAKRVAKELTHIFEGLNESKVQQLMSQSKKLMDSAADYRSKYKRYILSKFITAKSVKLRFKSRSRGIQMGGQLITIIANSLANDVRSASEGQASDLTTYDAIKNVIDSRLLTLALVKTIDEHFKFMEKIDEFSYSNILSGAFEKDNSDLLNKELSFEEAKPYIDKMLSGVIQRNGDTLILTFDDFQAVMYSLTAVRLPGYQQNKVETSETESNEYPFTVSFTNSNDYWALAFNNEK